MDVDVGIGVAVVGSELSEPSTPSALSEPLLGSQSLKLRFGPMGMQAAMRLAKIINETSRFI